MSRTYIYMNHHIREKHPKRPVIAVQRGSKVKYVDEVRIKYQGRTIGRVVFRERGLRAAKSHQVRAWVELY